MGDGPSNKSVWLVCGDMVGQVRGRLLSASVVPLSVEQFKDIFTLGLPTFTLIRLTRGAVSID